MVQPSTALLKAPKACPSLAHQLALVVCCAPSMLHAILPGCWLAKAPATQHSTRRLSAGAACRPVWSLATQQQAQASRKPAEGTEHAAPPLLPHWQSTKGRDRHGKALSLGLPPPTHTWPPPLCPTAYLCPGGCRQLVHGLQQLAGDNDWLASLATPQHHLLLHAGHLFNGDLSACSVAAAAGTCIT